jgi:predicted DNA-binding transcriptional regulator YafY
MNKRQRASVILRILRLAKLRSTGSPADLAKRLEIGVRTVKRLIKEIGDAGIRIRYSHLWRSYVIGVDYQ